MDADSAGSVYRNFRSARFDSIPFQCDFYCAADGCELGSAGRSVSGAVPLWPVLEADYKSGLLGEFSVFYGCDACEHLLSSAVSRLFTVAD